jgi:hypothetical protein|tara:strand:+ start:580 stop:771 length:192 start_codon:yes stop_codon:yes gene_type:complete
MVLDGVELKKATIAMLLGELLQRKDDKGNLLFNTQALEMSNGQNLMLTITPNFMMTWTNEEEE